MASVIPLIVSAEPLTLLGLKCFLGEEAGMKTCLEAMTATDALRQQAEHRPALVILCGIEEQAVRLIRLLVRRSRSQIVLVVSRVTEPDHVQNCLGAGALGYVTMEEGLPELRLACAAVLNRDLHVSRRAARHLVMGGRSMAEAGERTRTGHAQIKQLSEREQEVFKLMGAGSGCKEMACQLGISVKTVETHQQRMKDKLEVRTCAELKRMATQMCGR